MLTPSHQRARYGQFTDPPNANYESYHMSQAAAWQGLDRGPRTDPATLLMVNFARQAGELGNGARGGGEGGVLARRLYASVRSLLVDAGSRSSPMHRLRSGAQRRPPIPR